MLKAFLRAEQTLTTLLVCISKVLYIQADTLGRSTLGPIVTLRIVFFAFLDLLIIK
jgi:hypothetical protein